jgi:hypothetical protein
VAKAENSQIETVSRILPLEAVRLQNQAGQFVEYQEIFRIFLVESYKNPTDAYSLCVFAKQVGFNNEALQPLRGNSDDAGMHQYLRDFQRKINTVPAADVALEDIQMFSKHLAGLSQPLDPDNIIRSVLPLKSWGRDFTSFLPVEEMFENAFSQLQKHCSDFWPDRLESLNNIVAYYRNRFEISFSEPLGQEYADKFKWLLQFPVKPINTLVTDYTPMSELSLFKVDLFIRSIGLEMLAEHIKSAENSDQKTQPLDLGQLSTKIQRRLWQERKFFNHLAVLQFVEKSAPKTLFTREYFQLRGQAGLDIPNCLKATGKAAQSLIQVNLPD